MIDLVHIEHHHIIGSCFQNFNCHWLNNHQNSLTEFTYPQGLGIQDLTKIWYGIWENAEYLNRKWDFTATAVPGKLDNYLGFAIIQAWDARFFCLFVGNSGNHMYKLQM